MATLCTVASSLEQQLNSSIGFTSIATRVLLRTGVNLRTPKPGQERDPDTVMKVRAALADMGYVV